MRKNDPIYPSLKSYGIIMKNIIELDTGTRQLLSHIHGNVGIITLNRPEAKNALSDELTPALRKQISNFNIDDRVNVLIITGAGDAFCAGGDVKSMNSSKSQKGGWSEEESEENVIKNLQKKQMTLTHSLYNFSKPTIAALPGAAAGAGLSIALACDFRYASENAFAIAGYGKIALTGDYDNQLAQIGDVSIRIPSTNPQKIQLGYLNIGQVICRQVEDKFLLLNE